MKHTGFTVTWVDETGAERVKHFLGQAAIMESLLRQATEFQQQMSQQVPTNVYLQAVVFQEAKEVP